jgi:SSS family solute:Na+ symporter
VSLAVMIIVSYSTNVPDFKKINGLTYGTLTDEDHKASRATWNKWDVIGSCAIVAIILAAYLYFTG